MGDSNTRQRLRPWLEAKINSGQIQGLEWINREQHVFKVPWKHGGKHDWNEQDSQIFKEWAIHTGRFREGVDDPDWPTWKTRFRCALNKLPDIQEVKEWSKLDGPEPFRAYKFIPRKVSDILHSHRHSHQHPPPQRSSMDHQLPLPDLPDIVPGPNSEHLPSDLENINVSPFASAPQMKTEPLEDMDVSEEQFNGQIGMSLNPFHGRTAEGIFSARPTNGLTMSPTANHSQPKSHEMRIKLRYRDIEVAEHVVTNPLGCRLFYGPEINEMENNFNVEIYGPHGVDLLHFPLCLNKINNEKQETLTMGLLDVLDRGLVLENVNGDVYATRKCRCVIFVAMSHLHGEPVKLKRDERVKIFDYNYFESCLHRYVRGTGPKPSADVLIGFGQKWLPSTVPYNNILISASVYQCMAQYRLDQVSCSSPLSPPIEKSKSDDLDKFLDEIKKVEADESKRYL